MAEPQSQSARNRTVQTTSKKVSSSSMGFTDRLQAEAKNLEQLEQVSPTFKAFMDDLRSKVKRKP
jgi:hypothetical protein